MNTLKHKNMFISWWTLSHSHLFSTSRRHTSHWRRSETLKTSTKAPKRWSTIPQCIALHVSVTIQHDDNYWVLKISITALWSELCLLCLERWESLISTAEANRNWSLVFEESCHLELNEKSEDYYRKHRMKIQLTEIFYSRSKCWTDRPSGSRTRLKFVQFWNEDIFLFMFLFSVVTEMKLMNNCLRKHLVLW